MVDVNLWSGLRRFTDGKLVVSVEAATIGKMLDQLTTAYPGLAKVIEAGVSVAVDGEIITAKRNTPLRPDSEVYLIQQLKGG